MKLAAAFRHYVVDPLFGRSKLEAAKLPEPEPAYGKPRKMTGILALLTPEQRAAALAYRGDDTLGDPEKFRKA